MIYQIQRPFKLTLLGYRDFRLSLRGPQARSNLMRVRRDYFAEFILSAGEGLAMTPGRADRTCIALERR